MSDDTTDARTLVERLQGRYAVGPHLPNGNPEFGWRQFESPPIQHEAAAALTAAMDEIDRLRALLLEAATDLTSYVDAEYPADTCEKYPSIARRRHRDLDLVRKITAAMKGGAECTSAT